MMTGLWWMGRWLEWTTSPPCRYSMLGAHIPQKEYDSVGFPRVPISKHSERDNFPGDLGGSSLWLLSDDHSRPISVKHIHKTHWLTTCLWNFYLLRKLLQASETSTIKRTDIRLGTICFIIIKNYWYSHSYRIWFTGSLSLFHNTKNVLFTET